MAEDLKNLESSFNPLDELASFTKQLAKMRKDVGNTIIAMRKQMGTGLIDMKLVKKQFEELEKYVGKEASRFGTQVENIQKSIVKNFIQGESKLLAKLQKDRINEVLGAQSVKAEQILQNIQNSVATLDFAEAYEDALDELDDIMLSNAKMIEQAKAEGILKTKALYTARQINNQINETVGLRQKEFDAVLKINDQLVAAKAAVSDFVDSAFSFFDKIPGGEYFKTALGLDKIKEDIMKNVGDALSKSIDMGVNTTKAFQVALKGVVGTYLKFAKMIMLNPWTLALIGIALLIKQFIDLEQAAENFREATGLTVSQTAELTPNLESAAMKMRQFGVTVEDAYGSAGALFSRFKNVDLLTLDLIENISLMQANLGISQETGAQITQQFLAMKGVSRDNLKSWIGITAQLAESAGVAPSAVFADIAENAELIATYFRADIREVIKTAVAVQKLGLELEDVGKIIDTTMDWESSVNKELEASILLGKQINFNAARQMIFRGDIEGATKEVMNQVGSLAEFDKMNYIQKKAIAEATGLSVAKLEESLTTQKLLNEMSSSQRKEYDALNKSLEEGAMISGEQLLEQKRIHSTVTNLKASFMAIGSALGRVILPIINVMRPTVEGIATVMSKIADVINDIVDGFDKLIPGSKSVITTLAGLPLILLATKKMLPGLMGSLTGMFGKIFGGKKGIPGGEQLDLFGKGTSAAGKGAGTISKSTSMFEKLDAKKMLQGAAAILIISGALWVFAKALQEFGNNDKLVESMIAAAIGLGILTAAVFVLGTFMTSGVGALAIIGGAAAMAIMAGALWILGKAINEFVPMVDTLLKGIGVIVEIVGEAITKVITAVADSFVKLSGLGSGLAVTAMAIYALSGAMAAFIAVSTAGSFATMFSGLLGESPIDQLERLAAIGPGLMLTANALKQFTGVPEISAAGIGGTVELATTMGGLGGAIMEGNNKINSKLDEVIAAVKDINVYMDGRKVNENIARNTSTSKQT